MKQEDLRNVFISGLSRISAARYYQVAVFVVSIGAQARNEASICRFCIGTNHCKVQLRQGSPVRRPEWLFHAQQSRAGDTPPKKSAVSSEISIAQRDHMQRRLVLLLLVLGSLLGSVLAEDRLRVINSWNALTTTHVRPISTHAVCYDDSFHPSQISCDTSNYTEVLAYQAHSAYLELSPPSCTVSVTDQIGNPLMHPYGAQVHHYLLRSSLQNLFLLDIRPSCTSTALVSSLGASSMIPQTCSRCL